MRFYRSVTIFTVGVSVFVLICCFSGMLVYATYYNCDPLESGRIKAYDQLLPLFVMETVGHLRGVPGLFIAGVFGAALSSLSVALNSTSTVFLEDFVKGCLKMKLPEKTATILVKTVTIILGLIAVACLFVVEHMGGVLAVSIELVQLKFFNHYLKTYSTVIYLYSLLCRELSYRLYLFIHCLSAAINLLLIIAVNLLTTS